MRRRDFCESFLTFTARVLCVLVLALTVGVASHWRGASSWSADGSSLIGTAQAKGGGGGGGGDDDDDDDDDDDGGGGGGSSGGSHGGSGSHGGRDNDDDRDDDRSSAKHSAAAAIGQEQAARDGFGGEPPAFEKGVVLAVNPDPQALREAVALGFEPESSLALARLDFTVVRLRVPPAIDAAAALVMLKRRLPTAQYDLNHAYSVAAEDCNDLRCYPRAAIRWRASDTGCGAGVRIGMVDTAVNATIPALSGQALQRRSFIQGGAPGSRADHGTGIAALLVGSARSEFPGLLPDARLYAADVFQRDARGQQRAYATNVARGLEWLVSEGIQVVNMSITGPVNVVLERAVTSAREQGTLVIAAAGNRGRQAPPVYPAAYQGVVAVTAVDRLLQPYQRANRGGYIDFAAPGVAIWGAMADGSGRYWHGTSFAAAYATAVISNDVRSGAAALRRGPALDKIRGRAIDLGSPGRDEVFGWGLVQATRSCGNVKFAVETDHDV